MSISVDLQIVEPRADLPSEEQLTAWAQAALAHQRDSAELTIRIVGSEESQQLNATYREKNKPTNVLSFPFQLPPGIPAQSIDLIGDLVVCATVVEDEAQQQNKPLMAHWAHMIVHGCLHLLGYDHINNNDAIEMETLEVSIMQQLGYENPYQNDEI